MLLFCISLATSSLAHFVLALQQHKTIEVLIRLYCQRFQITVGGRGGRKKDKKRKKEKRMHTKWQLEDTGIWVSERNSSADTKWRRRGKRWQNIWSSFCKVLSRTERDKKLDVFVLPARMQWLSSAETSITYKSFVKQARQTSCRNNCQTKTFTRLF